MVHPIDFPEFQKALQQGAVYSFSYLVNEKIIKSRVEKLKEPLNTLRSILSGGVLLR